MDGNASPDRLSTLPPELLFKICSFFCQCCRDDICKYDLNPQGHFGPAWYLLPGKKSDVQPLSNLSLTSRSLRDAAQEVLHHAPYVEGTRSISKLCRTVVERPELGRAIRVLPVWDFGALEPIFEESGVIGMVDTLMKSDLPVLPELRQKLRTTLRLRGVTEDRLDGRPWSRWLNTTDCEEPRSSFLRAYAMGMIANNATNAQSFYCVQSMIRSDYTKVPTLPALVNLRECYLFFGEMDSVFGSPFEWDLLDYTHMGYDKILPVLFRACPQLSVLGLQGDLETLGMLFTNTTLEGMDEADRRHIPIQRLEIRFLETECWGELDRQLDPPTDLEPLLAFFEHAGKLSEIHCILLASHCLYPESIDHSFVGLIPIMNSFTKNMTTTAKSQIRRLAFLNPDLIYGDWEAISDDQPTLPAEYKIHESYSFGQHFPKLEILDISAHFAYCVALYPPPDSLRELRIHDSLPKVTDRLTKHISRLMFRKLVAIKNGGSDELGPTIFANPYHVDMVLSEEGNLIVEEELESNNGFVHNGLSHELPDGWLVRRSNEELEMDLRRLL